MYDEGIQDDLCLWSLSMTNLLVLEFYLRQDNFPSITLRTGAFNFNLGFSVLAHDLNSFYILFVNILGSTKLDIDSFREQGNNLHKKCHYREAIDKYSAAIKLLDGMSKKHLESEGLSENDLAILYR